MCVQHLAVWNRYCRQFVIADGWGNACFKCLSCSRAYAKSRALIWAVRGRNRLIAYKIVGHFYRKISGSNQVKNRFFRISNISVPCPHAQLRGRTVNKKLLTFFRPWGRDHSLSPLCWIFRIKEIHHPRPRRGQHGKIWAWGWCSG